MISLDLLLSPVKRSDDYVFRPVEQKRGHTNEKAVIRRRQNKEQAAYTISAAFQ